jgi:hypothetical protein
VQLGGYGFSYASGYVTKLAVAEALEITGAALFLGAGGWVVVLAIGVASYFGSEIGEKIAEVVWDKFPI